MLAFCGYTGLGNLRQWSIACFEDEDELSSVAKDSQHYQLYMPDMLICCESPSQPCIYILVQVFLVFCLMSLASL